MLRKLLIGAALVTGAGSLTFAQTTGPQQDGRNAPPSSLGDGPGGAAQAAEPQRPRASSPYWNNPDGQDSDLPATDIRAVPPARAADVYARWTHNQSLVDLNNATRMLVQDLEAREAFRQAMAEERSAYDAMRQARSTALAPLGNNDAYLAAESLRQELTNQIRDAQDRPHPDRARIEAMARLKLSYIADNRKLEQNLLERDTAYQAARARYIAAANAMLEQRQAVAMMVARDEGLQAIRRDVATSRIAKLASAAYLDSTIRARDIALDYAAFYRRTNYLNPPYGYGYANGYYPFSHSYDWRHRY